MSRNRKRSWLALHLPPYVPRLVGVGGVLIASLALVYLRIGHKAPPTARRSGAWKGSASSSTTRGIARRPSGPR